MARTTNGIIAKKVDKDEILTVAERLYGKVRDDAKATADYAVLEFKVGRVVRDLRITMNAELCDSEKSGEEYGIKLPDETTFLAMTYAEDSPEIMRNIVSQFGGYVQDDDSVIDYDSEYYEVEFEG